MLVAIAKQGMTLPKYVLQGFKDGQGPSNCIRSKQIGSCVQEPSGDEQDHGKATKFNARAACQAAPQLQLLGCTTTLAVLQLNIQRDGWRVQQESRDK